MRKWFFLTINSIFAFFIWLVLSFSLFLPKYSIVEHLSKKEDIFILSQNVNENLSSVDYYQGNIFFKNENLANFTQLIVSLFPLPSMEIVCPSGKFLKASVNFTHSISINSESFDCSPKVKVMSGKLLLKEKEIYGSITLKGLLLKHSPIRNLDFIELHFEGSKFDGKIKYSGITLTGGGRIKFYLFKPEKTYIDATFKGNGITLLIRGYLENPAVVIK
jgi:hypothetical protein